jgi:PASTA domain
VIGVALKTKTSIAALAVVGLVASVVAAQVAGGGHARPAGTGGAGSSTVSLAGAHALPDIQPRAGQEPADPDEAQGDDRAQGTSPPVPSRPGSGPATKPAPAGGTVRPFAAPAVIRNLDGISHSQACSGCVPPDPSAATSGGETVELVNTFIQVINPVNGSVLCGGGVTLNRLLRSSDTLTDPRIQFDNANNRFSLVVTIKPASTSATPALWVAASDTADACGTWRTYRLTFSGGPFGAGTFLDFPILGQDTNALLISTRNIPTSGSTTFSVFGLPKSTIYAGNAVSFSAFAVPSLTAPVVNAGQPMISSPFSYFLAAVPGTGYRLFRLSNSGGSGATLTLQATISASFNAPSREARQPGTTSTVDSSDGNILAAPYYDGASIWFTHVFDLAGFPAIRYGAVNVSTNTVTTGIAFRSASSDDFNPSLAVGLSAAGPVVYLNWAFTDAPNNVATSDVVDSLPAGQPIGNLIGTGTVLVNGGTTTQTRFGDFSSVAIDPSVPAGGCAWTAQQYFATTTGDWATRLARIGTCQPPVTVPNLIGDTTAQAGSALTAAGLTLGHVSTAIDRTCNNLGTVMSQSPAAGSQVVPGTAVNITIGQAPPPPFQCP